MEFLQLAEGAVLAISTTLITLFLGILLAKLVGKIVQHVLAQAEINRLLKQSGITSIDERVARLAEYTIYAGTILFILQQLGLTRIVFGILITIALILIVASIALSIRDFIPNATQGLFIRKKLKHHLGKKIKIGNTAGLLDRIGIIQSTLQGKELHYVPHVYTAKHMIKKLKE